MDALPSSPNINSHISSLKFCCHKLKKNQRSNLSTLEQRFDPGFTSQYSEFQKDLTELNLEAFIVLQKFENENIQNTILFMHYSLLVSLFTHLLNKCLSDTHYVLGTILEIQKNETVPALQSSL